MDKQATPSKITTLLHKKLTASLVTVVTFVSLTVMTVCIFWYTMTHALNNYLTQQTDVLGSSLATQAAFNATQSILTNDLLSLNVLLNRLVVDENILSARVYNKKDELLAEADSSKTNTQPEQEELRSNDKRRVYSSSIKFRDEIVGHVLITLDKTPAQATLQHLNNLLIGVAIFTCTIAILLVVLMTRWLFTPINEASEALIAFSKGDKDIPLPSPSFKEGREICQAVESIRKIELPKNITKAPEKAPEKATEKATQPETAANTKAQFEINFDAIFEESKQRSCVLYFDIINLEEWHKEMTPLQVANLLTPIYRAIFQASDIYQGQVHQYKNDSALIFFSAANCEDNLYVNAVCTAQLFLGLIDELLENELYKETPKLNFHLSLHQGNLQVTNMVKADAFEPNDIENLLNNIQLLSQSKTHNKLVMSEEIFTLSHIQNRVFSSLPEIIELDDGEIMAYEVKGMSEKYKEQIQEHISNMTQSINI